MKAALEQHAVAGRAADPRDVDALASALEGEARLLESLAETLRNQRAGVANDDVQLVDESVYGAWRVMRTLEEARRRRITLTERVLGVDVAPSEWLTEFGPIPSLIGVPRERLLAVAETVAREIEINRRVLDRAIRTGEQTVRALCGATAEPAPCYAASAALPPAPAASSLINRQI